MPSRVIRGEFRSSKSMASVSMEAELTFAKLILSADDFGRLDARLQLLKSVLYPVREAVTKKKLKGWLDELAKDGCIRLYEVDGRPFLCLPNWETHRGKQRRRKEPQIPPPPEGDTLPAGEAEKDCPGDPRISGNLQEMSAGVGVGVGVGVGGGGAGSDTPAEDPLFPGFAPREPEFYSALALPTGNPAGVQYEPGQVLDWHRWQWFQRGLSDAKPKGMTLAIKNRWRRLGDFFNGDTPKRAELDAAKKWCDMVRHQQRKKEILAESAAQPDKIDISDVKLRFAGRPDATEPH